MEKLFLNLVLQKLKISLKFPSFLFKNNIFAFKSLPSSHFYRKCLTNIEIYNALFQLLKPTFLSVAMVKGDTSSCYVLPIMTTSTISILPCEVPKWILSN